MKEQIAKTPYSKYNSFAMTEEQKQFYINNNAAMTMGALSATMGISSATLDRAVRENNLPKKVRVFNKKEEKFTEFFDWDNATLLDPIQGYLRKHY